MSVAVLENTAPIEAVARAITTPVMELVMMAAHNEYVHGKLNVSIQDGGMIS